MRRSGRGSLARIRSTRTPMGMFLRAWQRRGVMQGGRWQSKRRRLPPLFLLRRLRSVRPRILYRTLSGRLRGRPLGTVLVPLTRARPPLGENVLAVGALSTFFTDDGSLSLFFFHLYLGLNRTIIGDSPRLCGISPVSGVLFNNVGHSCINLARGLAFSWRV